MIVFISVPWLISKLYLYAGEGVVNDCVYWETELY